MPRHSRLPQELWLVCWRRQLYVHLSVILASSGHSTYSRLRGGGCIFKRMVQRCLKKVIGHACLTCQVLVTIIVGLEMTLNSRPLSYFSSEYLKEPLTPSHLLYKDSQPAWSNDGQSGSFPHSKWPHKEYATPQQDPHWLLEEMEVRIPPGVVWHSLSLHTCKGCELG